MDLEGDSPSCSGAPECPGASPETRLSTFPCAGFSLQPTPDPLAVDNQPWEPRASPAALCQLLVGSTARRAAETSPAAQLSRRCLKSSEEQISSKTTQGLQLAAVGPGHFRWAVSEGYSAQTLHHHITTSVNVVLRVYPRETNQIIRNNPVCLGGLPFKSKLQN